MSFLETLQLKQESDTLIFDYGNTLVLDPFLQILKIKSDEFRERINKRGYENRWEHLARSWIRRNKEFHLPFISHFYQENAIIERALREVGIDKRDTSTISQELLDIYKEGFKEVLTKDSRRIEVKRILVFLRKKGVKLGVLSNEGELALDLGLDFYGIIGLFDLVLSSEEVKVEKPDVKVFNYALEGLDSKPETSVFVGDDPIRDILPAKKIGMKTILYVPPHEYSSKASWRSYKYSGINPDFVIKKFAELKQIV